MARELAALGCPTEKLWINRAGIPLDEFPSIDRAGRSPGPPIFLHAGRLIPKKGLAVTIDAFARVVRELPGARLWIAGEGPLRGELEAQIARLGLAGAVELLGFLDAAELLGRLHRADLFVHPSVKTASGDREGIPNSMLEAMATGLAPLTTRHAGIPEAVRDGENGWLVPEGAIAELAERMLWCARNRDAVVAAGRRARELVEREYALELRMRLLDEKYEELIAAHAGAVRALAAARSAS
jgi:glycosyltransferase involved in cell wall biosynthesis